MCDLSWVEQTQTFDAVDRDAVAATDANPRWKLLGVGIGTGGQSTLTYGWPWQGAVEIVVTPTPALVAAVVNDALLKIQDREGRKLLPMIPWSWAEEIAGALVTKGLIRG